MIYQKNSGRNKYSFLIFTEAVKTVTTAGTAWLLVAIVKNFILPKSTGFVLGLVLAVFFVILPIAKHIGIFIAIRRHNNHVAGAVSGQHPSALVRREKKVAIDMIIVIAVLLLSLVPALIINTFQDFLVDEFEVFYVWTTTIIYLNSSINPIVYFFRNSEIRSAIRSMVHC